MDINSLQKIGVRLYYYILKLHKNKLPKEMRNLGDKYVAQEFRLHKKANEEQYKQFLDAWIDYYRQISNTDDIKHIGKSIDPETWNYFNNEQKESLNKLKDYTSSNKKE